MRKFIVALFLLGSTAAAMAQPGNFSNVNISGHVIIKEKGSPPGVPPAGYGKFDFYNDSLHFITADFNWNLGLVPYTKSEVDGLLGLRATLDTLSFYYTGSEVVSLIQGIRDSLAAHADSLARHRDTLDDHALRLTVLESGTGTNLLPLNNSWTGTNTFNKNVTIANAYGLTVSNTTSSGDGVIYKDGETFIHNFEEPGSWGDNTFIGERSGNFTMATSGQVYHASANTGVGYQTLNALTTGWANTAVGRHSQRYTTTGTENTSLGRGSLISNTTGSGNTAIGKDAVYGNLTGDTIIGIGHNAWYSSTTSGWNLGIGEDVGYYATGQYNTFIGHRAGNNAGVTASYSTLLGYDIDLMSATANFQLNIAGNIKLRPAAYKTRFLHDYKPPSTGDGWNVFVGYESGREDLTATAAYEGSWNIGIGYRAAGGAATGGTYTYWGNTAIGNRSMEDLTTGYNNVGVGYGTLMNLTSGYGNLAFGRNALLTATTGNDNVGIGKDAGFYLTSGSLNVFIGVDSGEDITTGIGNTLIGNKAGNSGTNDLTTGSYNILIGNSVAAGSATGDYQLNIGDLITGDMAAATRAAVIEGDLRIKEGTGTATPPPGYVVLRAKEYSAGVTHLYFENDAGTEFDLTGGSSLLASNNTWTGTNTFNNTLTIGNGYGLVLSPTTAAGDGVISKGAASFIHDFKDATSDGRNFFAGESAGAMTFTDGGGSTYLGSNNTAVGYYAMGGEGANTPTTAWSNAAFGTFALSNITTGFDNTAMGKGSLHYLTDGNGNTALGKDPLHSVTTGDYNIGIGHNAVFTVTTGSKHIGIGPDALYYATGEANIAIGWHAGNSVTTGSYGVIIGNNVQPLSATLDYQLNINNLITGIGFADSTTTASRVQLRAESIVLGKNKTSTDINVRFNSGTNESNIKYYDDEDRMLVEGTNKGFGTAIFTTVLTTATATPDPEFGYVRMRDIGAGVDHLFFENDAGTEWDLCAPSGFATTTLNNLGTTAINASLVPATMGSTDLGTTLKGWGALFLSGTKTTKLQGSAATTDKTITFPNLDGTVLLTTSSAVDFPTLNQNTTGSAAKWTTARNLAGNSVDGSGNVAFANKFIVQGTVDAGLSGAQFLGALSTGLLKNTNTTGVLSIAVPSIDYAPPTSGSSILMGNGSGGFTSVSSGVAGYLAEFTAAGTIDSTFIYHAGDEYRFNSAADAGDYEFQFYGKSYLGGTLTVAGIIAPSANNTYSLGTTGSRFTSVNAYTGSFTTSVHSASFNAGTPGAITGTITLSGETSGTVTLKSAAAAGTYTLTFPTNDGDVNQFLQTNGSGVTSWQTISSVTGTGVSGWLTRWTGANSIDTTNIYRSGDETRFGTSVDLGDYPWQFTGDIGLNGSVYGLEHAYGTSTAYYLQLDATDGVELGYNNAQKIRLESDGLIYFDQGGQTRWFFGASSQLLPATNAVYDIGNPSYRIATLYGTSINITNTLTTALATVTGSAPKIWLVDTDTYADCYLDASTSTGSLILEADVNAEAAGSIIGFQVDGSEVGRWSTDGALLAYRGIEVGQNSGLTGEITLYGASSNSVKISARAAAGGWTMLLPGNDGDAGQFLQTDGDGNTSWASGGGGGSGSLYSVEVSMTAAQVLAMDTSPYTLIDAPGGDYAIQIVSCAGFLNYGGTQFNNTAAYIYPDGCTYNVGFHVRISAYDFNANSDDYFVCPPGTSPSARSDNVRRNAAIKITASSVTTGNSTLKFWITYRLIDLGPAE